MTNIENNITLHDLKEWAQNKTSACVNSEIETVDVDEVNKYLGEEYYYRFYREDTTRGYLIVKLKDQIVLINESIHLGQFISNSLRNPSKTDKQKLQAIYESANKELLQLKSELQDELEKDKDPETLEEDGILLFLQKNIAQIKISQIQRRVDQLQRKLNFVQLAINEVAKKALDKNEVENNLYSLKYSKEELKDLKNKELQDELERYEFIVEEDKKDRIEHYRKEKEICPACYGEHSVLESRMGEFNRHYYKERLCHFCWGERSPFYKYLNMGLAEFEKEIESIFQENRIYYRIFKKTMSKRSRVPIKYVSFNSSYDMMPNVSEVYNLLFAYLTIKETKLNSITKEEEKLIADILNQIYEPTNKMLFLTCIFPFFQQSRDLIPKLDTENSDVETILKEYRALMEVSKVWSQCFNAINNYGRVKIDLINVKEKFQQINIKDIIQYQDRYKALEMLINILYFMEFTGKGIEDYTETDKLTVVEVLYFCRHHPNSPFKNQALNEKDIRKWIKEGSLIGVRQGKYYVGLKDLLLYFSYTDKSKTPKNIKTK